MTNPTQTIGRYRIQRKLGSGAMGTVYLAMDPLLMRLLAVKVVSEIQGDNSEVLARFHREALISAKLNHPHIITIFDVGEDPVRGPFLAMEYVDGATLAELINERLSPEKGLGVLIQVMGALLASEAVGVSHRDVKPDNVLVGKDWRVKLLDFGIAHGDEARITRTGVIFSTPYYAAPEVLLGTEASCQSDRYSFAVTAFEVLSGALPFNGTSIGSVLFSILKDPPTIPDAFSPGMKRVFERALDKEPAKRYPDLLGFMDALLEAVVLTDDAQQHLRMQVEELRRHAHQAPLTRDPAPILKPTLQASLKALTLALTAVRRKVLSAPNKEILRMTGGGAITRVALVRSTVLLAGAATLIALFLPPVRARASGWFAGKHPVNITSSPGGARMFLDGRAIGVTPVYGMALQGSAHTLRIELAGYRTETREIRAGETKHFFPLKAEAFFIPVNSDPSGAQIFLNDQPMGSTPVAALKVPTEGRQELVMRKSGYREWRAIVDPDLPLSDPIRLNPKTVSQLR